MQPVPTVRRERSSFRRTSAAPTITAIKIHNRCTCFSIGYEAVPLRRRTSTYYLDSGENDIIPKLVGKSALDVAQGPPLFLPKVLQLRFEKRDLIFVRCFLQIFLYRSTVFLERFPEWS